MHSPTAATLLFFVMSPAHAFDRVEPETPPADEATEEPRDSDGDGIPDRVELASGTSPIESDSDNDGVPDGVEDANQDGVLDKGETDPRVPGLFPGSGPHIPEPMNFDLVRGLGAREGELEVNVLMALSKPSGGAVRLDWAPEVEWAIVDNLAVEAEFPMVDRELAAYKGAIQWTAPQPAQHITHGLQAIGEYRIDEALTELTALYLLGGRINKVSLFAMAGARLDAGQEVHGVGVLNPSIFYDATEFLTLGLENNLEFYKGEPSSALTLAQVHWQVSQAFRVQAGGGVEFADGQAQPVAVARLILE